MTGGQTKLKLSQDSGSNQTGKGVRRLEGSRQPLLVVAASDDELSAHTERVALIKNALWQ